MASDRVDESLLKSYGILKTEGQGEKKERLPRKCVRCETICAHDEETCHKWGMALTLEAALKRDDELLSLRKVTSELVKQGAVQTRLMVAVLRQNGDAMKLDLTEEDRAAIDSLTAPLNVP